MAITRTDLRRTLEELIAALDGRAPRIGQSGEAAIARDAAELRDKALKRLDELADRNSSTANTAPIAAMD